MTIKNFFLNDFAALTLDRVLEIQSIENETGEIESIHINEKAVVQNDGSTRFFAYYIPNSNLTARACGELIKNYESSIEWANGVESIPGIRGDFSIGSHTMIYSKRIYFYTEIEISSADIKILHEIASDHGLYVTFRSKEYLNVKMETKPLAFISHDSYDKENIAKPIAIGLMSRLCPVWYDEYSLKIGDSLRHSIEKGIKEAKKCILILTPEFLSNPGWTKKEFDSIFTREMIFKEKIILPVWSGVSKELIYEYSPALADTVAVQWPERSKMSEDEYKKEVELIISKIHTALK